MKTRVSYSTSTSRPVIKIFNIKILKGSPNAGLMSTNNSNLTMNCKSRVMVYYVNVQLPVNFKLLNYMEHAACMVKIYTRPWCSGH